MNVISCIIYIIKKTGCIINLFGVPYSALDFSLFSVTRKNSNRKQRAGKIFERKKKKMYVLCAFSGTVYCHMYIHGIIHFVPCSPEHARNKIFID